MEYLMFAMVWALSGLFVAFLMKKADESKNENHKGKYWLKNRSDKDLVIFLIIIGAPIALFILGTFVMIDYCDEDK